MDIRSPTSAEAEAPHRARWVRRVGWLLLIWLASVMVLGVVALAFRLVMAWVGLTR